MTYNVFRTAMNLKRESEIDKVTRTCAMSGETEVVNAALICFPHQGEKNTM